MTRTTVVGSIGTLELGSKNSLIWRAIQMNELNLRQPVLFVILRCRTAIIARIRMGLGRIIEDVSFEQLRNNLLGVGKLRGRHRRRSASSHCIP